MPPGVDQRELVHHWGWCWRLDARLTILVNPILAASPFGCRKLEHFRHLLREHDIIYIV